MSADAELLRLDAGTLARRIASHTVSCRELMQATLARIAALNPLHNAIVSLRDGDALLAEADARDAALARGEAAGWMHGFPIAVKDLSDVQGLPTTRGSPAVGKPVAQADALFVERMKKAGVRIGWGTDLIGELDRDQCTEFALRSDIFSPVEILRQATSVNAEIMRQSDRLGKVAPGFLADLIVVDGDPLRDLGVFTEDGRNVPIVIKGGEIVKQMP